MKNVYVCDEAYNQKLFVQCQMPNYSSSKDPTIKKTVGLRNYDLSLQLAQYEKECSLDWFSEIMLEENKLLLA